MAQNKIDGYDISRYMSLIIPASISFRADVLKSSYSFYMELMVEQSNLVGCFCNGRQEYPSISSEKNNLFWNKAEATRGL